MQRKAASPSVCVACRCMAVSPPLCMACSNKAHGQFGQCLVLQLAVVPWRWVLCPNCQLLHLVNDWLWVWSSTRCSCLAGSSSCSCSCCAAGWLGRAPTHCVVVDPSQGGRICDEVTSCTEGRYACGLAQIMPAGWALLQCAKLWHTLELVSSSLFWAGRLAPAPCHRVVVGCGDSQASIRATWLLVAGLLASF